MKNILKIKLILLLFLITKGNLINYNITIDVNNIQFYGKTRITIINFIEFSFVDSFYVESNGVITLKGQIPDNSNIKLAYLLIILKNYEKNKTKSFEIFAEHNTQVKVIIKENKIIYEGGKLQKSFTEFYNNILSQAPPLNADKETKKLFKQKMIDYISKNLDKPFVYAYIYNYLREAPVNFLKTACDSGKKLFPEYYFARSVCIMAKAYSIKGKKAYNFSLLSIEGDSVSLSDLRGNYVLITFWASYCVPCIKEIPKLNEIYQKYRNKNLKIVSIFIDTYKKDKCKELSQKYGIKWISLISDKKVESYYNVYGIPKNILISPDGTILEISSGLASISRRLKQEFK